MDSVGKGKNISVQIARKFDGIELSVSNLKKLVRGVCKRFGISKGTVSIAVVDDKEISGVNKKFLNHDYTTDCLSFNLSEKRSAKLFELVVNGQMACREAKERGHSAEAELALYITHGLLHNVGFDDANEREAEKMHQMEDEILQQEGYGCVYNSNGD
jgi:probable rRNA maturation factor